MRPEDADTILTLPDALAADYEVLSCLKYSEQTAAYLLRRRLDGKTVFLKTASEPLYAGCLKNEKEILEVIHRQDSWIASTFPHPLLLQQHGDSLYYIRTYIEGSSLEELCESSYKKPGISAHRALDYAISLTEMLQFLHSLHPPLIHRDIKPQNIIVDAQGVCHFIDLGISRFFGESKRSDTVIMGTRLTAPPEQFGYQQTDIRSDLYSLGIVLLYCLTGEYEVTPANLKELDVPVADVIGKATMFDPDKRYQTAEELLPDLLNARFGSRLPNAAAQSSKKTRILRTAAPLLLLCLLALTVFAGTQCLRKHGADVAPGQTASSGTETPGQTVYTFREPLIETAVRRILNLPEGDIYETDLEKITSLHIIGQQIYDDESELWFRGDPPYVYNNNARERGLHEQQGSITSLEDIAHMPNLTSLALHRQQIRDISLLKDTKITELGLGYNPLTDLTPLKGNASIRSLNLSCLKLADTSVLATLSSLEELNLNGTGLKDLDGLERCPLRSLNLFGIDLTDYAQLQKLEQLRTLHLSFINEEILASIQGIPVEDLWIYYSRYFTLDGLSVLPALKKLYLYGGDGSPLFINDPQLPALESLDLCAVTIHDFHALASLTSLESLLIYGADCESFDGLDELPRLKYITCTAEQMEAIRERYPDNAYIFNV